MLDAKLKQEISELSVIAYSKKVPVVAGNTYSLATVEETLRDKFKALAPNYNAFRRNKLDIFELIQETVDEVAPNKIIEKIGDFSDVKSYKQGARPKFKVKKGKNNVKRFITKVGLGGVYERVRLDKSEFTIETHAVGGSAYIEWEAYLDGQMDFSELCDLIIEGIEEQVYVEVRDALIATYAKLPTANKHTGATTDMKELRRIINTVQAYSGGTVTIFCTPAFASTIEIDAHYVGTEDKADMRNQGYLGKVYGANVVTIPQSFTDETNTEKIFSDQYAFIIPSGGSADEKIVKVVLEGETIVKDIENRDSSMEFQAYKKFGTAVLTTNHFGIYRNSAL